MLTSAARQSAPFKASIDFFIDNQPNRLLRDGVLVCLALTVVFLAAFQVDDRTLSGVSVWAKPIKFSISIGVQLLTVLILSNLAMTQSQLNKMIWRAAIVIFVTAALLVLSYIGFQGAQQKLSHFNNNTHFEAAMFSAMGVSSMILIAAPLVMSWFVWKSNRLNDKPGLRTGILVGAVASFVMTTIFAGQIVSNGGYIVGEYSGSGNSFPITGWAGGVGDLRVSHFFATHAIQVFPVVGYFADRFGTRQVITVWIFSGMYSLLTLATFIQAMNGNPLFGPIV